MIILVSACLMGAECRYDGKCKLNADVLSLSGEHLLVPFCPEIYGGLPTPREPVEIKNGRAVTRTGADVTDQFESGAEQTLKMCKLLKCDCAVLQDRSPSCGAGTIHDGTFTGGLAEGDGFTASLLKRHGIRVVPASAAQELMG